MKRVLLNLLFAVSALTFTGCSHSGVLGKSNVDTSQLDEMAKIDPASADFAGRVKQFYHALQRKDWATTYDFRTTNFKHDVLREMYLKNMAKDGKDWNLEGYEILNVTSYGFAGENYACQLIVKFTENGKVSYNSVWWKKEKGL